MEHESLYIIILKLKMNMEWIIVHYDKSQVFKWHEIWSMNNMEWIIVHYDNYVYAQLGMGSPTPRTSSYSMNNVALFIAHYKLLTSFSIFGAMMYWIEKWKKFVKCELSATVQRAEDARSKRWTNKHFYYISR